MRHTSHIPSIIHPEGDSKLTYQRESRTVVVPEMQDLERLVDGHHTEHPPTLPAAGCGGQALLEAMMSRADRGSLPSGRAQYTMGVPVSSQPTTAVASSWATRVVSAAWRVPSLE
jgi:hypothetical protein